MATQTLRADEIIPGDMFDTGCGVGDTFAEVLSVKLHENDRPGSPDRIEIRLAGNAISNTRTLNADYRVTIVTASAIRCDKNPATCDTNPATDPDCYFHG
jgi:hypothetical protein